MLLADSLVSSDTSTLRDQPCPSCGLTIERPHGGDADCIAALRDEIAQHKARRSSRRQRHGQARLLSRLLPDGMDLAPDRDRALPFSPGVLLDEVADSPVAGARGRFQLDPALAC